MPARRGRPAATDIIVSTEPDTSGFQSAWSASALGRTQLLSADEEAELSARARAGDSTARHKMVEANMRLVMNIARKYHSTAVPYEDLVQEGAIGLITACERYDPARGYRFSTYAIHWIRQAIIRALDNKSRAIRIPAHVTDAQRKLDRARADLLREYGDEPTLEQVSSRAGISITKALHILHTVRDPISLDTLVGEEENSSLGSLLANSAARDPEKSAIQKEVAQALNGVLNALPERERRIVRRRLGLEDSDPQILQEIGAELSLSRERVRQIEVQAFRRMRAVAIRTGLQRYLLE